MLKHVSSSVAVYQPKSSRGRAELAQTSQINKTTIGYDKNSTIKQAAVDED